MAYTVKITPRAQRDLADLYERIHAGSPEAAARWYWGLRDAVSGLRTHPRRWPVINASKELRHLLYGRKLHVYCVIYRIAEKPGHAEILTVRHGAMDRVGGKDL